MPDEPAESGMVGLFWMVEASGQAAIISLLVPLERAEIYGDMLTVDTGHIDYWSQLARRGDRALRKAGIPTAPIWSEYEEWPRGRVVFNFVEGQFVVYGDRQVFECELQNAVLEAFGVPADGVKFSQDGHYRSTRSLRSVRSQ